MASKCKVYNANKLIVADKTNAVTWNKSQVIQCTNSSRTQLELKPGISCTGIFCIHAVHKSTDQPDYILYIPRTSKTVPHIQQNITTIDKSKKINLLKEDIWWWSPNPSSCWSSGHLCCVYLPASSHWPLLAHVSRVIKNLFVWL